MKKQTVFKKLLSSIMAAVIILGQFSGLSLVSEAATIRTAESGKLYLSLSKTNENGNGYAFGMDQQGGQGKHIWSIMSSDDLSGTNKEQALNIYCIKADYGATWADNGKPSQSVLYNKNYEMPLKEETKFETVDNVLFGQYKNQILWLIDNLYVDGESDLTEYLKDAGIVYEEGYGYAYVPTEEHDYAEEIGVSASSFAETVQKEDIIAIQQAAIWYYTNKGEGGDVYNKKGEYNWLQYTNEELLASETAANKYPELSTVTRGTGRADHAIAIYNYLIDEAQKVAETLGDKAYQLKNVTAELWISVAEDGTVNGEQPVIEVHRRPVKPFDLSLRKAIVSVSNKNGENRELFNTNGASAIRNINEDGSIKNVETSSLVAPGTTATYNHRKDPIVVETGDTVKYSITIYNEGEEAGYANKIVDQLPGTWGTGLRLQNAQTTVTSTTGNIYTVGYETSTNTITLTMAENSPKNVLGAYDAETETLASETVLLDCIVMGKADSANSKILTNIAYIAQEYNAEQDEMITTDTTDQDRDSQTWNSPKANSLLTTDIGYTGNSNNSEDLTSNDTYYAGEQDDDDFEKIIILPKSFDLSLRKNITKVNNKAVENDRTPSISTEKLDLSETTAEYNHRKDAVVVKNGDKVEYNISLYNEGSIDGIATIVKDQLPVGLKLNLEFFKKEGDAHFITSAKGNVYKVTYNEESNIVTFQLDETKTTTVTILKAFETGKALDQDVITLQCQVNCTPDDKANTYLTNIAYIYEAKQEDGTIVTNQKAGTENGSEADRDSQPYTHPDEKATDLKTVGTVGYIGNSENNGKDLSNKDTHFKGEQDDDDFEKLVIVPKMFDLKLIKFITEVNSEVTNNRVIKVDTSKLNTTDAETTATYILEKNPVAVKGGDIVTYTLRVYNEGHYDGYATEISEDIPEGLEFIVIADGVIYSWDGKEQKDITEEIKALDMYEKIVETNSNWGYDAKTSVITTNALSEELIKGFGQEDAEYADSENKIDYKEIKVMFRVKQDIEANKIIRNEAAISKDKAVDEQGNEVSINDRDSKPEEWNKESSDKNYDQEGKWPIYKEDDEDYDNIITKSFDLSLRKQIVYINDGMLTRHAKLLEVADDKTLYDYYNVYNNKPKVKAGDIVTYSIRVYNEGEIDGYASLIVDTLPSGLEFYSSEYEGIDYGWKLVEGTENVYQTDYLSYEKDTNKGKANSTIIKAYSGEGQADYEEVFIVCKVKDNVTKEDKLLNVAQIADDCDENGKPINDKDSIPGTSDDEKKWKEEDDLDIEILQLQEFDLALRKFITQIENGDKTKEVTTRIPVVTYDEEKKELVYTHPKDALVVHVGDTVIYTLRVYNEGDIDGYASEIKDDIPEYLEYLPEHSINKDNEWVMYDRDGKVTEKVEEAVCIRTEHLAKGKGVEADKESKETNLIEAFDPESELSEENPDYRDIKVAFKVKDPNSTEYEIINFAQISEDSDSNGDPIKDKDSEPDNGEKDPKEDDEDIEKVKVQYFDLSLLKYVTKVLVNENGEERIIETGNVGDENDIIPHVQINKKNIDKTVVKFVYSIKITNEGQIAGEATEITDYVPEGLVFVAEDNEHWTDEGNNVISTRQLTGSTINPGESVEVEVVLRWINGADNLGPKVNVAEISEDYNEEDVPDKDSTPDNKKEGEDDIDNAEVILSVNQGGGIQSLYINLIITFLLIILVGGILIKKFVL